MNLPKVGFNFTTDQLFMLTALPSVSGALLRVPYSFMVPIFGGRRWTAFSTGILIIPCVWLGFAVQDTSTPYSVFIIISLLCGFAGANFASSMANISFFFPKQKQGGALGLNTSAIYAGAKDLLPYGAVLVLLTVAVMLNLKRSKYGRAIMAIRDNRIAAESVGLNVTQYKLAVFVIAAFFAGSAGVLYGHSLANIKAAAFDYNMSIEILVIVVLGGMGSVPGSVISAIVLTVLPEALRGVDSYRMLVYAIVLILVMQATNNPTMKRFFGSVRRKLTPKKKECATL